jgi:hypothetical protein
MATWENRSYVWQIYDNPVSSNNIFCRINVATCKIYNHSTNKKEYNHLTVEKNTNDPLEVKYNGLLWTKVYVPDKAWFSGIQ